MVLETLVHSPLNHVTRLLAGKYYIEFSRRTSFRLCNAKNCVLFTSVVCRPPRYMTKWLRCTDVGEFHADIVLSHTIYIRGPLDLLKLYLETYLLLETFYAGIITSELCPKMCMGP
jgi:hypothetical protein